MSAIPIPQALLAAASQSAAVEPDRLNSERIAARFGSYGIEIIAENGGLRRANLYSGSDDSRTCRTYAVVETTETPADIGDEHRAIVTGHSIGATFRRSGWRVAKRTLLTAEVELAALDPEVALAMRLPESGKAALHLYELDVDKAGHEIHYATILEVHHPEYLKLAELDELFRASATGDSTISQEVLQELLQVFGLRR